MDAMNAIRLEAVRNIGAIAHGFRRKTQREQMLVLAIQQTDSETRLVPGHYEFSVHALIKTGRAISS